MTDRAALLDYAEDALDGTVSLGTRAPRTAAVLARCALEDWVDEQSADWSGPPDYGGPTTASKLVVLGTRHGPEVGEQVKRLWHGLSRACHHHAYELQPSAAEIQALIAQVRALTGHRRNG